MIIAIASGKGGTGKTTVAVNLARAASGPVCLLYRDLSRAVRQQWATRQWNKEEDKP